MEYIGGKIIQFISRSVRSDYERTLKVRHSRRTDGISEMEGKPDVQRIFQSNLKIVMSRGLRHWSPEGYPRISASISPRGNFPSMHLLKLDESGLEREAGQAVSYVITKYKTARMNRATRENYWGCSGRLWALYGTSFCYFRNCIFLLLERW